MRLQVDTLNKVIAEKDINTFYTSVNPSDYYNKQAKPIALKAYSAVGPSAMDDTYSGTRVITQAVKLPKELGEFMYNKYKEDKIIIKTLVLLSKCIKRYLRTIHSWRWYYFVYKQYNASPIL